MNSTADITAQVVSILERAKIAIQAKMDEKNINASGRTSASLRVETYDGGVRLVIGGNGQKTAPLATLEVGRKGGKVPQGFAAIIEQWSRDKGLVFATESKLRSFAYLTARKIAREGTLRNKQNVDVYSSIVAETAKGVTTELYPYYAKLVEAAIHGNLNI